MNRLKILAHLWKTETAGVRQTHVPEQQRLWLRACIFTQHLLNEYTLVHTLVLLIYCSRSLRDSSMHEKWGTRLTLNLHSSQGKNTLSKTTKSDREEHSIIESFKETDLVASCFAFNEQVSSLAVMLKVRSEWQEGIKHIKIREKCISGRGLKLQGHRTEGEFDGKRWVSGNKIRLVVKCQIIQGFQTNKQFVFYSEMPHWYQPGNHKRLCWDEEGGDSVQNGCWCSPLRYLDSLSMSAKLEEKKNPKLLNSGWQTPTPSAMSQSL